MPGNLFTNYFLTEGIKATAEWRTSISDSTAFAAFRNGVRQRYDALSGSEGPNEAVTEQELIRPVLELLGWADYLPQQGTTRNEDIPDYLLFTDAASKERAAGRANPEERFRDAIVVEESKRFGLSLDAITAWWPMPGCCCPPASPSAWVWVNWWTNTSTWEMSLAGPTLGTSC